MTIIDNQLWIYLHLFYYCQKCSFTSFLFHQWSCQFHIKVLIFTQPFYTFSITSQNFNQKIQIRIKVRTDWLTYRQRSANQQQRNQSALVVDTWNLEGVFVLTRRGVPTEKIFFEIRILIGKRSLNSVHFSEASHFGKFDQ